MGSAVKPGSKFPSMEVLWTAFTEAQYRRYLVSEEAQECYASAWNCFESSLTKLRLDLKGPKQSAQEQRFAKSVHERMTEQLKLGEASARSINTHLSVIHTFTKWASEQGHLINHHGIAYMIAKKQYPDVLTPGQIKALIEYKPKNSLEERTRLIALLILDTGLQIDEALSVLKNDLILLGSRVKIRPDHGRQQRFVPLSPYAIPQLYCYKTNPVHSSPYLFSSINGKKLLQRNAVRDLSALQRKIGIPEGGWTKFRHTFALTYIRNGGDVLALQDILGHANPNVTMGYVLEMEKLKSKHGLYSALGKMPR